MRIETIFSCDKFKYFTYIAFMLVVIFEILINNQIKDIEYLSNCNMNRIVQLQLDLIKSINDEELEIKESRHREDLLYQEVKNLDYLTSVLTTQLDPKRNPQ